MDDSPEENNEVRKKEEMPNSILRCRICEVGERTLVAERKKLGFEGSLPAAVMLPKLNAIQKESFFSWCFQQGGRSVSTDIKRNLEQTRGERPESEVPQSDSERAGTAQ